MDSKIVWSKWSKCMNCSVSNTCIRWFVRRNKDYLHTQHHTMKDMYVAITNIKGLITLVNYTCISFSRDSNQIFSQICFIPTI